MTYAAQDKQFVAAVISDCLLEEAIDWIQTNMNPEDVFSEDDLSTWADNNGRE